MKTTSEQIQQMKLELLILDSEIKGFLNGDWRYEYFMTIGYNKVFTGRRIYNDR